MRYRISEKAIEDIETIWLSTLENWSVEQADRYVNLIFDELEYLAHHPIVGKDIGHTRTGYRFSKVKSHLVFYKTFEGEEIIEIIRVLHQRMDIENRLED